MDHRLVNLPLIALLMTADAGAVQPPGASSAGPVEVPASPNRVRTLSFSEALAIALGGNESLLAARLELRRREREREAARALRLPSVTLAPLYTHLGAPVLLDLGPIRDTLLALHPQVPASRVPPFEETLFEQDMLRLPLAARLPLYTGGRLGAADQAARARVRAAQAEGRSAESGVVSSLVRAYFGLRLALAEQQVRMEVLDGLRRHHQDARRLEEEGLIARTERLAAQVALAEAERQAERAGHDVAIARAGLRSTLARDDDAGEPGSALFVLAELPPLERLQEQAERTHPALERLDAHAELARAAVRAERGALLPQVFAYGMYELRKADLSPIEPEWMAGVGARIELFDGGARRKKLAAARIQEEWVNTVERKARRDIRISVERSYREAEKAREQYQALESSRSLADESLRARTRAFEEGLGTSLEVVDARLAQARVRLERLAAAYAFDQALADLLEASGQAAAFEELRAGRNASEVEP